MLRKITRESGSVVWDRVFSSSSGSQSFHNASLKTFSTWLDLHHSTFAPGTRPEISHSPTTLPKNGRRFASTRHSLRGNVGKNPQRGGELSTLPRFMRRQHLQKTSTQESTPPTSRSTPRENYPAKPSSSTENQTYRSRHYNPEATTSSKSEKRLLEPHVLSGRLKKLCDDGKIDDAVYMLKNAPLDAQNSQVWNTLIWECLKGKRFQMGYQLFVDMKRRGFSPTTRTFQTFFTGLSKIDQWATHPKQLTNARSLYQYFLRHLESVKKHDPTDPSLTVSPLGDYIRILGHAGRYQEVFDVFYAMDQDGPLAATQYIYGAMFEAILAAKKDTVEGSAKAASDARMLWTQMVRNSKRGTTTRLAPDSYTVGAAIKALSGGSTPDHGLAFSIIHEYFGLISGRVVPEPGLLSLRPESLAAILQLCNQAERYTTCREFIQQVKRRPEDRGGLGILDRAHLEEGMKAEIALREPGLGYHAVETLEWMLRQEISGENGPRIRPALSTYNLVIQSCWRSADWRSATRVFDLLTGYHAHDFMDGATLKEPRFDQRGRGRNLPLTAQFMSVMLLTAVLTKSPANIRQGLRIVDYMGFDKILRTLSAEKLESSRLASRKEYYSHKFASAVSTAVAALLKYEGQHARPEETKKWNALDQEAKRVFDKSSKPAPSIKVPPPRRRRRVTDA